jgi:acyl-CoA thioester hydrolase
VRSARINQKLKVRAEIVEWENRLRIDYRVSDAATGEVLTRAHTIQVAVALDSGEMQFASPPVLFERLGLKAP